MAQSADGDKGLALSLVRGWLGRYSIAAETLALLVAVFMLLRIVLLAVHVGSGALTISQLARVFSVGLRFDLMAAIAFLFPMILSMTFLTNRSAAGRVCRLITHAALLLVLCVILLICCAEFVFFDEFQSRLNYIAYEYLIYPTEVLGNIWESYPVVPLLSGVVTVAIGMYWLLRKRIRPALQIPVPWPRRYSLLVVTGVSLAGLWITTGMQSTEVSPNRVANECAGNGLYSFVYYAWTSRIDYEDFYLTTDLSDAYKRVRSRVAGTGDQFHSHSANPLDRTVISPVQERNYNVVLILEESLGSDFIGALGDRRGLTPCFDRLSGEGILFDNFYATGNRTARALEATLASLPPIPSESILKREHNDRVYTLARVLAERDYNRLFVYGGNARFDGMYSFTMANGFQRFVEQKDYSSPTFANAWGVCDEDIFHKAIDEFDELHEQGRPFFSLVLTVSNHPPFTFPDGRVDLVHRKSGQIGGRLNGVKYADWALGDFFDRARSHAFYENTMFVVMGDHGARVYGSQSFPIKSYRVPVLMILPGGEDKGTRCGTLASSLDIAPTIMGVLGGSYRSVFFGRDARHINPATGYALMQHNHDVALLESNNVMTVLGSQNAVRLYQFVRETFSLTPLDPTDTRPEVDAISLYQAADRLYYEEKCFPGTAIELALPGNARRKF